MKYFYLLVLVCISLNAQWRREDELIVQNAQNRFTSCEQMSLKLIEAYDKNKNKITINGTEKPNNNLIWQAFVFIKWYDAVHEEYTKYAKPMIMRQRTCKEVHGHLKPFIKCKGSHNHPLMGNPIADMFRKLDQTGGIHTARKIRDESNRLNPKIWEYFEQQWVKQKRKY